MKKFYEEDSSVGLGLGMVPKLKYTYTSIHFVLCELILLHRYSQV